MILPVIKATLPRLIMERIELVKPVKESDLPGEVIRSKDGRIIGYNFSKGWMGLS